MTESDNRGESASRGELLVSLSVDAAQCAMLIVVLEETGHGGCADDLEAADYFTATQVAYDIAEHLEEGCGAPTEVDIDTAHALIVWADQHDKIVRRYRDREEGAAPTEGAPLRVLPLLVRNSGEIHHQGETRTVRDTTPQACEP